jgi:hypothetical protein
LRSVGWLVGLIDEINWVLYLGRSYVVERERVVVWDNDRDKKKRKIRGAELFIIPGNPAQPRAPGSYNQTTRTSGRVKTKATRLKRHAGLDRKFDTTTSAPPTAGFSKLLSVVLVTSEADPQPLTAIPRISSLRCTLYETTHMKNRLSRPLVCDITSCPSLARNSIRSESINHIVTHQFLNCFEG